MNHPYYSTSTAWISLLVGVALVSWPSAAGAAAIGFHNTLKMNIYVEAVSIVRGRVIRDKPLLLPPGKVGWHMNVPPGNRVIYIYDANPPVRLLYRNNLAVGVPNLFFAVKPVRGGPAVKLVPARPPKN
jgi:hypothetical protein